MERAAVLCLCNRVSKWTVSRSGAEKCLDNNNHGAYFKCTQACFWICYCHFVGFSLYFNRMCTDLPSHMHQSNSHWNINCILVVYWSWSHIMYGIMIPFVMHFHLKKMSFIFRFYSAWCTGVALWVVKFLVLRCVYNFLSSLKVLFSC